MSVWGRLPIVVVRQQGSYKDCDVFVSFIFQIFPEGGLKGDALHNLACLSILHVPHFPVLFYENLDSFVNIVNYVPYYTITSAICLSCVQSQYPFEKDSFGDLATKHRTVEESVVIWMIQNELR